MDIWPNNFLNILEETVKVEFEEFCQNITKTLETFTEEVSEGLETFAEQLESMAISSPEIEEFLQELWEPVVEIYIEIEDFILEDLDEDDIFVDEYDVPNDIDLYINPKVEPTSANNPACIGCQHYHGRVYEGNLLVCAMHPYGWDDENCPDWEK